MFYCFFETYILPLSLKSHKCVLPHNCSPITGSHKHVGPQIGPPILFNPEFQNSFPGSPLVRKKNISPAWPFSKSFFSPLSKPPCPCLKNSSLGPLFLLAKPIVDPPKMLPFPGKLILNLGLAF